MFHLHFCSILSIEGRTSAEFWEIRNHLRSSQPHILGSACYLGLIIRQLCPVTVSSKELKKILVEDIAEDLSNHELPLWLTIKNSELLLLDLRLPLPFFLSLPSYSSFSNFSKKAEQFCFSEKVPSSGPFSFWYGDPECIFFLCLIDRHS